MLAEQYERTTVPDDERGCKFLKPDKTYLRADVTTGGDGPPAFVEFDEPIPFREDHFRTYKRIDGEKFLASVAAGPTAITGTVPRGEAERHFERLLEATPPGGADYGRMPATEAQDLLMWTGGSYYETPEEFMMEARTQGVNKAIPMSSQQEPPVVVPGRTKLFIIHPKAVEMEIEVDDPEEGEDRFRVELRPGVIGYTYLTRVIHTRDEDGSVAKYVEDYEETMPFFDVVERGDRIEYGDEDHPLHDVIEGSMEPEDVVGTALESGEGGDDVYVSAGEPAETDVVAERREIFEASPLNFHDYRKLAAKHGLLEDVEHPDTDQLLDALAESEEVALPKWDGDDQ